MAGEAARSLQDALAPYMAIMRDYIEGKIADVDFEAAFNPRYLKDGYLWPDSVFKQLDAVFAVAEEFEVDPVLRAELADATDEVEMRQIIEGAYAALTPLIESA